MLGGVIHHPQGRLILGEVVGTTEPRLGGYNIVLHYLEPNSIVQRDVSCPMACLNRSKVLCDGVFGH